MAQNFYEVFYTALDGNVIGRDVKHFTDEKEAIAFHNSLKDNDKIASAIIDKVYYDPKSFLSGRTEIVYYANPIHKDYLNSRSGDKRFEDPEPIIQFLKRKLQARKEFALSSELNEMNLEEIYKDIKEADIKEEKSTSIEKIYMDMLKNELPSQDEVNDAFEKFEREAHYLNNKPVGEWDATDMSNWKSILRKGGKLFMSVKESMAKYRLSYTKKDSSKSSQDFIGALNAEDEFYELMDDDNIISAKVEFIGGDEAKTTDTWSRGKDGKVDIKVNK